MVSFLNAIHALYQMPTLRGLKIDLSLIMLEFLDHPGEISSSRAEWGDRDIMYKKFCDYQVRRNYT